MVVRIIFISVVFFLSCQKQQKTQYLYLEGPKNKTVALYKVQQTKAHRESIMALRQLTTQTKTALPFGEYLVTTECSSYKFQITEEKPTHISVSIFNVRLVNNTENPQQDTSTNANVDTLCIDKRNGNPIKFSDKKEFDILPGKTIITVAGKNFASNAEINESKTFFVELSPIKLISTLENDNTQYFIKPIYENLKNVQEPPLQTGQVNSAVWLNPGKYELEINGTKSVISIEPSQSTVIQLGALRIEQPKNFPSQDRIKRAGQPVFAYINKNILFNLNKDYTIFPNKYMLNLDNSNMEKAIEVTEGALTKIQTYGAEIDPPVCADKNCRFSQKVVVYTKQPPYALFKVSLGVPFLVFQDEYQYSIEGADGLFKTLSVSSESVQKERIGRLTLNWKVQISENDLETTKTQIEPICCQLSGQSIDLSSYKPKDILLPSGEYRMLYSVRQKKNGLRKNSIAMSVSAGHQNSIVIPVYADSAKNKPIPEESEEQTNSSATLTPIAQ